MRKYYYLASARILSLSCFLRYEYDQFSAFYNQGSEVFPPSTSPTITQVKGRKSKTKLIAILASCLGGLAILLFGSCIYLIILRRRNHQKEFEGTIEPKAEEYPNIRLETIHAATNNFSDTNKLGEGGFGPVYKGIMNDGKVVAIKRLSRFSDQGAEEFANEVQLIMQLQHKNLVTLLGFCADADEKLLVYEYMANSSLDVILFDDHKRAKLHWSRRVNIISGIAKGILYLHEDSRLRVIHRDLKASNVLLDNNMNPKISDFGMARIFAGSEGQAKTATLVGTIGYMAPEYAMDGLYSVKSDVFGFGVLLLEIITGRRNADTHLPAPSLLAYAWQLWNEEKALKLIDPLLHDSCDPVEFLRYLHIGLLCVQEIADDRPTMSCVVLMLNSESITLSQPEKPAYSIGTFTDLNETSTDDSSINGLTVSVVSSR